MAKVISKFSLISLFFCIVVSLFLSTVYAQIPHLINYQGKLTDTDGNPVADGAHSIIFRIYDAENGGNLLWEETQSILVQKGVFSCLLGGATNLEIPFDKPYWLAIKVGSDEEMTPRQQITSSGYAIRAERAVTAADAERAVQAENATRADDSDRFGGKSLGEISYEDLDAALQDMIMKGEKTVTGISGVATASNQWVNLSPEMTFELLADRQVEFDLDIEIYRCGVEVTIRLLVNDEVVDTQSVRPGGGTQPPFIMSLGSFANCPQGINNAKVQMTYPNAASVPEARAGALTARW